MNLIVQNPSPVPVSRWITVTAPRGCTPGPGAVGRSGFMHVIAGGDAGPGVFVHARMDHALASIMPPGFNHRGVVEWTGDLADESKLWLERPNLTLEVQSATPMFGANMTYTFGAGLLVYLDSTMRVSHERVRYEPLSLVADLWVYQWRGQETFEWELLLNMSHPEHDHVLEKLPLAALSSEGFLWADDAKPRGFWNQGACVVLTRDARIADGQSIAAYGRGTSSNWANYIAASSTLLELPHRMTGTVEEWVDEWGPFHHDFGVSDPEEVAWLHEHVIRACRAHANRVADKETKGDLWAGVPYGLQKEAGTTGDQHAFGLAKLGEVLICKEPLFLIPARYSATHGLACRPSLFREEDGAMLDPAKHPRLVLWDERPHWHWDVSPDRLGKARDLDIKGGETNGWFGIDDQHFSPLFEIGTYALTGSFMLGFMLEAMAVRRHCALTYPSKHPRLNGSTNDMNTSRAVGRSGLSLAWLAWALPGEASAISDLLVHRTDECVARQWAGLNVVDGLVRPLRNEEHGGMPQGNGWRPTFDAIGLIGLVAAHRAGSESAASILVDVVKTILRYGLEPTREPWWGIYWDKTNPGKPVPCGPYNPTYYQWGGGRWGEWAGSGLKIAAELLLELKMFDLYNQVLEVLEAAHRRYVLTEDPAIKPEDKPKSRIRSAEWIGRIPVKYIPVAD